MQYKSCQWVNRGIEFRTDEIRLCCYGYLQGRETEYQTTLFTDYHGGKIDWDAFFKKKDELKQMHKEGKYLDACKDCIYLHERDWDEENYINHFTFNHWTKCNCNCTYCYTNGDKKAFNKYKEYKIYPIIKDMFKQGIIKKMGESCLCFGGGEPTILDGFDKLIDLFVSNGAKNIRINTSGIKYSKAIEKALKLGVMSIVISTDAGCEQTYEKVKQVKCYKKVWENIRKYNKAAVDKKLVKVKYILIPGFNDNYEEINKWFDEVVKNGVTAVSLSVEQDWYNTHQPDFTPEIYEQIAYMEKRSKELNLDLEIYCEALAVLRSK
ncbi:radical SAM protein [bacterium]|nr:radical SAM protein [bacterium]